MKEFIIDDKNSGKKLFRYIKGILPGLKNSEIFKLIRKKTITVNKLKSDSNYILQNDDKINIFLHEKHFNRKGKSNKFVSVNAKINIIFEDDNILVVNKPVGQLCHPDNNNYKDNLHEAVRSYLYKKREYEPTNPFSPTLCHRIDRNTSGVIIIAKNHNTLQKITKLFRERNIEKEYITLVFGNINKENFIVSKINTTTTIVKVTNFKILNKIVNKKEYIIENPDLSAILISPEKNKNDYSLIKINLLTGKKHQIRAMLKEFDHPLLGDKKYNSKISFMFSKKHKINRYYLHAYRLKINNYPEFIADIPEDFSKKIENLFNN